VQDREQPVDGREQLLHLLGLAPQVEGGAIAVNPVRPYAEAPD
jgi:hypothetical protein